MHICCRRKHREQRLSYIIPFDLKFFSDDLGETRTNVLAHLSLDDVHRDFAIGCQRKPNRRREPGHGVGLGGTVAQDRQANAQERASGGRRGTDQKFASGCYRLFCPKHDWLLRSRRLIRDLGGSLHGTDDARICGTTTGIAGHAVDDLLLTGVWFFASKAAKAVMAKMRETPVNDFYAKNGKVREDGRMVHDMYFVQVKTPEESTGPWDYYKILSTTP